MRKRPRLGVSPLQRVPEASYDGGAVGAGDGLPQRAADVVQDVVAALHGHLHPGGALGRVQGPRGHRQVLDTHVVLPEEHQLHLQLSAPCRPPRQERGPLLLHLHVQYFVSFKEFDK